MTKYKVDINGLPRNGGARIQTFAREALEAHQCGKSRGEFILAKNERLGHSLSWDKLRLIHDMWERWELEANACNAIEQASLS